MVKPDVETAPLSLPLPSKLWYLRIESHERTAAAVYQSIILDLHRHLYNMYGMDRCHVMYGIYIYIYYTFTHTHIIHIYIYSIYTLFMYV